MLISFHQTLRGGPESEVSSIVFYWNCTYSRGVYRCVPKTVWERCSQTKRKKLGFLFIFLKKEYDVWIFHTLFFRIRFDWNSYSRCVLLHPYVPTCKNLFCLFSFVDFPLTTCKKCFWDFRNFWGLGRHYCDECSVSYTGGLLLTNVISAYHNVTYRLRGNSSTFYTGKSHHQKVSLWHADFGLYMVFDHQQIPSDSRLC